MLKIYVRGNKLAPAIKKNLTKADLRKYWLTDEAGKPVGKPFLRRSEIELYQALNPEEPYEIVTNPRGKPRLYETVQERKAAYDRKRDQTPERKAYKAAQAKKRRQQNRPDAK